MATTTTSDAGRDSRESHDCARCGESSTSMRRCGACRAAWYCSKECQTGDWSYHKFSCQPHKVTTADRLALAVRNDMLPQHPQTREDYGFDRATTILADEGTRTPGGETMLFGLYIGLLNYREVLPQQLHHWRRRGVLAEEIVRVFDPLPVHARGGYYAWFLRHPEVLDMNLPIPSAESFIDISFLRAWRYAGRPATTPLEEIKATLGSMPKEEASCFTLVSMLVMHGHPPPSLQLWIDFGFCVCDEYRELELGRIYQELVARSSFSEIVAAYQASTMVALFESKGLAVDQFRYFKEVMAQSPRSSLFVWHLKAFVVDETRAADARPLPGVGLDYGFWNCQTREQHDTLCEAYKRFFDAGGDPLELNSACYRGSAALYACVVSKAKPKDNKVAQILQNLMRNVYPLQDPGV